MIAATGNGGGSMGDEREYPATRPRACHCGGDLTLTTERAASLERAREILRGRGRGITAESIGERHLPVTVRVYECTDAPMHPGGCGRTYFRAEACGGSAIYVEGVAPGPLW